MITRRHFSTTHCVSVMLCDVVAHCTRCTLRVASIARVAACRCRAAAETPQRPRSRRARCVAARVAAAVAAVSARVYTPADRSKEPAAVHQINNLYFTLVLVLSRKWLHRVTAVGCPLCVRIEWACPPSHPSSLDLRRRVKQLDTFPRYLLCSVTCPLYSLLALCCHAYA